MEIPLTVRKCLDRFNALLTNGSRRNEEIVDVFGRFRVWAGNVSAHTSGKRSLRYRLRDSSELTGAVLAYLKEMLNILEKVEDEPAHNELGEDLSEEYDEQGDEEGDEELFEVHARQPPAQQALEELDDIISGLMRISMALRNPARNDQVRHADTALAKLFQPRDIEHVRMKYPNLPQSLAQRLGKSISQHRQYFTYRREHNEKLTHGIDDPEPDDDETRQSTVATTLFKPGIQPGSFHEDSDNGSIGTATSYAPSESSDTLLRPPPRPVEAMNELPFECNICYHIVTAPNERLWRQHVYEDLPPYTCMHEDCQSIVQQFSRRNEWRRHTLDHYRHWVCPYGCEESFTSAEDHCRHLSIAHHEDVNEVMLRRISKSCARNDASQSAQCPFCSEEKLNRKLWFKHVGHHLEQLALFALPTRLFAADSGEENEGDVGSADANSEDNIHGSAADTVPGNELGLRCICGYDHDDGYSIECHLCKRWQHVACYYPNYESVPLPEDESHFCVNCVPRSMDVTSARARQQRGTSHEDRPAQNWTSPLQHNHGSPTKVTEEHDLEHQARPCVLCRQREVICDNFRPCSLCRRLGKGCYVLPSSEDEPPIARTSMPLKIEEYQELQLDDQEEDLERRDRLAEVATHDELDHDGVQSGHLRETKHRGSASNVSEQSYNASGPRDTPSRGGVKISSGGTVLHVYGQANIERRQDKDGGTVFVIGSSGKSYHGGEGSETRSEGHRGCSRSRRRVMIEEDSFDEEDYSKGQNGRDAKTF